MKKSTSWITIISWIIIILAVPLVAGSEYKKHTFLEVEYKSCLSQLRDQVYCDCIEAQLDRTIPSYSFIRFYQWFADQSKLVKSHHYEIAVKNCGIPKT